MDKHWLITYQQRACGRKDWVAENCATSKSPAQWLLDTCAKYTGGVTVLLFAVEITDEERQLIAENI